MKHNPRFLALVQAVRPHIREGSWETVDSWRASATPFVVVDVREESEWAGGHVPGALLLGKGVLERDIEAQLPDPGTRIALYCGGGYRSALAAYNLQQMGYADVWSVDGGWRAWTDAGRPVSHPSAG